MLYIYSQNKHWERMKKFWKNFVQGIEIKIYDLACEEKKLENNEVVCDLPYF